MDKVQQYFVPHYRLKPFELILFSRWLSSIILCYVARYKFTDISGVFTAFFVAHFLTGYMVQRRIFTLVAIRTL
jgi:hypothetical protein